METERPAPGQATQAPIQASTYASTSPKPMLRALAGEAVWPPPMWLMRQAGRYLPEYREVRAQAGDFIALCTNPELAAEVTLQPIRRYGMDAAILFSDILMVPWAWARRCASPKGEGPQLEPRPHRRGARTARPADLRRQCRADHARRCALVRAALDRSPNVPLIGFAGSPWTVACYMVEGHGSRDFAAARGMAYGDPQLFAG